MTITSTLFEAFIKCPTKCFLKSLGESGTGNEFANWVQAHQESYRAEGTNRLKYEGAQDGSITGPCLLENLKTAKWRFAVDVVAHTPDLESQIHALELFPPERRGITPRFIPIRFVVGNKLTRDNKLLLTFDALVLAKILGRNVGQGRIIHSDNRLTANVRISALADKVRKQNVKIATLLSSSSPPDLVLNRHCAECEFREVMSNFKCNSVEY